MSHSEHLVGLEGINVLFLFVILNIHAGSAFPYVSASSTLLNEVEQDAVSRTYFSDGSVQLLFAIAIQTSHEF